MKQLFFISTLILINLQQSVACDICGCSISNGFSTILPQFNKNFIGIRGSYSRYNSHHIDDFQNINHEKSISAELYGRFYLHKKIQLLTVLPYNIKSQQEGSKNIQLTGFGDASISINYTFYNINIDSLKWKHLLLAGAGIKLPTGRTNIKVNDTVQNIYLQPGTGSFDYLITLLYTIRHKKLGWSNDVLFRYSSENSEKYAFGNKYTFASRLFYWQNIKKSSNLLPSIGILLEKYDKDYKNGYLQKETGGYLNSLTMGCEFYYKNLLISFNYLQPISQNLSNGNVKSLSKIQVSTNFLF